MPRRPPIPSHAEMVALALALIAAKAPPPALSPDGAAMRRALAHGGGALLSSGWPPLWAPLAAAADALLGPPTGAWALGLACAALAIAAAARLAGRLGGAPAAYGAALCLGLLPSLSDHAAVLDARPLGAALFTLGLAAIAGATHGGGKLWPALLPAALAPLARDEGIVLLPMVIGVALLWPRLRRGSGVGFWVGAALAAAPRLLWAPLRPDRLAWEGLWADWAAAWPVVDFVALMGPADAPTELRALAIEAAAQGLLPRPSALRLLAVGRPGAEERAVMGLLAAVGAPGAALLGLGLPRQALGVGAGAARGALSLALIGLWLGVGAAPMAWAQASAAANLQFLVPGAVAVAFAGLFAGAGRAQAAIALCAALLVGLGAHLGPHREPAPRFAEDSAAAALMERWLRHDPPATGRVWCTWAGRAAVESAGLEPALLPPHWARFSPSRGDGLLLSSIDLDEHTGGRSLALVQDRGWRLRRLSDGAELQPVGAPRGLGDWYAYLKLGD